MALPAPDLLNRAEVRKLSKALRTEGSRLPKRGFCTILPKKGKWSELCHGKRGYYLVGYRGSKLRGPKQRTSLRGVGREDPLHMAEFFIGQEPGEPKGHVYQRGGRLACRVGMGLKTKDGVIPFKHAQAQFLRARAHFLGGEDKGGAGATAFKAVGSWRDPASGKVFDEPTMVGQVIWFPNKYEPTPKVFRTQMKKMCEDVACRLAQKEVLLQLTDGGRTTVTRCSPRGKAPPQ